MGLPPLVGYLAAGFALSGLSATTDVSIEPTEVLGHIAHLGVLLLLFTVGLKLIAALSHQILETKRELRVFHGRVAIGILIMQDLIAGTRLNGEQVVTNGGQVLCATALGNTVTEAQQRAYQLAQTVHWDGVFYRKNIAYRAIAREQG